MFITNVHKVRFLDYYVIKLVTFGECYFDQFEVVFSIKFTEILTFFRMY